MSDSEENEQGITLEDIYEQNRDILLILKSIQKSLRNTKSSNTESSQPPQHDDGYMRFNMTAPRPASGMVSVSDILANARRG